jgi:hypothetical protein
MTRLNFVKKARKDYEAEGIKRGDSYYWWAFRFGPTYRSKTRPTRSRLTQSEFMGTMYNIEDRIGELGGSSLEDATSERDSIVSELQDLASEQEDKLSNMPDGLQEGSVGQLLQERADYCNEMADELDNIDLDIERDDGESDEDFEERCEDAVSELTNVSYNGS